MIKCKLEEREPRHYNRMWMNHCRLQENKKEEMEQRDIEILNINTSN